MGGRFVQTPPGKEGKVRVHPIEGRQLRGTKDVTVEKRCQGRLALKQKNMGFRSWKLQV